MKGFTLILCDHWNPTTSQFAFCGNDTKGAVNVVVYGSGPVCSAAAVGWPKSAGPADGDDPGDNDGDGDEGCPVEGGDDVRDETGVDGALLMVGDAPVDVLRVVVAPWPPPR